jgi:dihydroorotate dehydrogenase electron transfer subunit
LNRVFKASVIENKQLIKNHFLITLRPSEKINKPTPGTFFMLSVNSSLDPLLKRPFSIHRWLDGDFQLLYRVAGKGTHILSGKKQGNILEAIGPLGRGFSVKKTQNTIILVAGGLGIAPIFALAESCVRQRKTKASLLTREGDKVLFFYGARTKKEVLCLQSLKSLGIEPILSTDDGTLGKKGNIVNVLKKYLTRHPLPIESSVLYSCGPEPMLKSLSAFAGKNNLKGYAALEQSMACGIGTCLGCVVNTSNGYKRVCKEGPVFPMEEIVWD